MRYNSLIYPEDYQENYYIEVPCGKCALCRRKRANGWRIRLFEEYDNTPYIRYNGIDVKDIVFVCFTFDDKHLPRYESRENVALLIKRWRDLWRKKYGRSPRYFATTDKGSQFGRLHLHLLLFKPYDYKRGRSIYIEELALNNFMWRNGTARLGEEPYIKSEKGITYVCGYITGGNLQKDAIKHGKPICKEALEYVPMIFVSNGLGRSFVDNYRNNPRFVIDSVTGNYLYRYGGYDYGLPTYYKYKLVPYFFRWHSNLLYKYEQFEYRMFTDVVKYSLSGSKMSLDLVERLYWSSYAKYDNEDIRKFNLK